jgi:hypothetical protein
LILRKIDIDKFTVLIECLFDLLMENLMNKLVLASFRYTGEGDMEFSISKIENHVAYDQFENPIPDRVFRFTPWLLDNNWVRPKELVVQD